MQLRGLQRRLEGRLLSLQLSAQEPQLPRELMLLLFLQPLWRTATEDTGALLQHLLLCRLGGFDLGAGSGAATTLVGGEASVAPFVLPLWVLSSEPPSGTLKITVLRAAVALAPVPKEALPPADSPACTDERGSKEAEAFTESKFRCRSVEAAYAPERTPFCTEGSAADSGTPVCCCGGEDLPPDPPGRLLQRR
ncbi:hypothetical protein cyc_03607 [Cyclospora cayetanensis]|uniref:Uncharacterized protein n=1 Tax=Cyclospora cayetanensis TaxID=88456 RepID=A0A1D3CSY6_9EIME|nr:hypothetical protein cyc_03607 [Cyclospora cayetanensis]